MSKLNELIKKLCPNGVEYKKLGEIATITRGGSFQKKDFVSAGIPCIHYGQIYTKYGLFSEKTFSYLSESTAQKQKMAKTNDIIMAVTSENIDDVCKCVAWLGTEEVAVSGHAAIIHHQQNAKYLSYFFHSSAFSNQKKALAHGTKVIEVTPDKLSDIVIPVPPLIIQTTLVELLDSLTDAKVRLEKALRAEISYRETQYEHYYDRAFQSVAENSTQMEISQVASTFIGLATSVTKWKRDKGIQLLHNSDICRNAIVCKKIEYLLPEFVQKNRGKILRENDVITIHTGDVGTSAVVSKDYDGAIGFTTITSRVNDPEVVLPQYLCCYLNSRLCKQQIKSKTISDRNNLNLKSFNQILIPIPKTMAQKHIVDLLLRIDDQWHEIKSLLMEEIQNRQKQYEYYVDKLLSFEEVIENG